MNLFYTPDIALSPVLTEEESQHAVKVLRLKVGDQLNLVDGKGSFYTAKITIPHPKRCEVEIISTQPNFEKRNFNLHIAIAPTKNIDRFEWFIEKVTEIGVDEITPIVCHYSERKIIKPERLEKIVISAAKQSLKAYFPILNPLRTFNELIESSIEPQKFIAHCYKKEKNIFQDVCNKSSNVLMLIGPEGDFSLDELELALTAGFIPVSLGDSRLRTETAGMVACHTVQLLNQRR